MISSSGKLWPEDVTTFWASHKADAFTGYHHSLEFVSFSVVCASTQETSIMQVAATGDPIVIAERVSTGTVNAVREIPLYADTKSIYEIMQFTTIS